jgi:hypothetical protein
MSYMGQRRLEIKKETLQLKKKAEADPAPALFPVPPERSGR